MKNLIIVLFVTISATAYTQDQLKNLSKEDASKALTVLKKQRKIYLYCGCCEGAKARKIRAERFDIVASPDPDKYQLQVSYYAARSGTLFKEVIDLAYTWGRRKGVYYTIASRLNMPHDPCNRMKRKWED